MRLKKYFTASRSRGDTLVEVLFATATAAFLIVVTLTLMNRNLAQIQMSVETTFAREAIDSQAEVLRYMRDQYMENRSAELTVDGKPTISKLWKDMVDPARNKYAQTSATEFGTCQPDAGGSVNPPAANNAFFIRSNVSGEAEGDAADITTLDANNAENLLQEINGTSKSQTYARPGQGMWIEAVSPSTFTAAQTNRYVDFHIRSCWEPPFSAEMATLGTIVRLYYETPGGNLGIAYTPRCSDGVNNDGDALIDLADPGCIGPSDNDETDPPPPIPPPIPSINIIWSHNGSIPGKICVKIWELVESGNPDWNDNYLCSDTDYGLQWQISFTVPAPDGTPYGGSGVRCTYFDNDNLRSPGVREGESDSTGGHAWDDNYLCSSTPIELEFRHSQNPAKDCIKIIEPSESLTWPSAPAGGNNPAYLCFRKGSP